MAGADDVFVMFRVLSLERRILLLVFVPLLGAGAPGAFILFQPQLDRRWILTTFGFGALLAIAIAFRVGRAIRRPVATTTAQLHREAERVTAESESVRVSCATVAAGSSKQAAALEEASATLEQISGMTQCNADNARKAQQSAEHTRAAAENGATKMQQLIEAMEALRTSSSDVSRIIKTIDEIAFQTNILALNAAVEAARAGEAGAGFAVVAEEVRTLARRSARAAAETSEKITVAINRTNAGADITTDVAHSLDQILTRAREVVDLVNAIAAASGEQSLSVAHVTGAIREIDRVTQTNAAAAHQTSASATELEERAHALREAVAELQRFVSAATPTESAPVAQGRSDQELVARRQPPRGGTEAAMAVARPDLVVASPSDGYTRRAQSTSTARPPSRLS